MVVQLAAVLSDEQRIYASMNMLLQSQGREIHPRALEVHGISTEVADQYGIDEKKVANIFFFEFCRKSDLFVCHNKEFDMPRMAGMIAWRISPEMADEFMAHDAYCTMKQSADLMKIPFGRFGQKYKYPKLAELHQYLFSKGFEGAHDAMSDVLATRACYYELKRRESAAQV
jgi:DNA polymerase III epsilon subunit-like protein